jgi:hypothetical protein
MEGQSIGKLALDFWARFPLGGFTNGNRAQKKRPIGRFYAIWSPVFGLNSVRLRDQQPVVIDRRRPG